MGSNLLDFNLDQGYAEWMEDAYCRTHPRADIWHGDNREQVAEAASLCKAHCPVIEACLKHALDNQELEGVWGGTTGQERSKALFGINRAACLRNHPAESSELRPRASGNDYCAACQRYYHQRTKENAA